MAHPSIKTPSNIYVVGSNQSLVAKEDQSFSVVSVLAGTSMTVKASGVFSYKASFTLLDMDGFIDQKTGKPFDNVTEANLQAPGYFERVSTNDQTISVVPGMVLYGRFTKVSAGSGASFLVYR